MNLRLTVPFLLILLMGGGEAQTPSAAKKPPRNPPQYPHILDLSGAELVTKGQEDPAAALVAAQSEARAEAMLRAVEALATEMRTLVMEIRAMNLRQQTQIEIARLSRVSTRIDSAADELRVVRDRLGVLGVDEQNLLQLMTRESLLSQSFNIGTLDRERTMEQIRLNHEVRLRQIQAERDRLQRTEQELQGQLEYYLSLQEDAEKRLQQSEEQIRLLATPDPKMPPPPTP
jgi:hypothetical protein